MASSGTKMPPTMPDLCYTRHSKTQLFSGPVWKLRSLMDDEPSVLYVHEKILKPSFLGHSISMEKLRATSTADVCCTAQALTMVVEYLYTGEYSPTIQDIKLMHPDVQDLEANRQLEVFDIDGAADDEKLRSLVMSKLDACQISPSTFFQIFDESTAGDNERMLLWCKKWVKAHHDELCASDEFSKRILKGGWEAKVAVDFLNSAYQPSLEGEETPKRRLENESESDGRPSKAPKHGESTV